jgi:hypothetical protein
MRKELNLPVASFDGVSPANPSLLANQPSRTASARMILFI